MVYCSYAPVTMVNGERASCTGVYKRASFSIAGDQFSIDFFVLPLLGYDVVLGTQWLTTLGPILLDYAAFTMSFGHKERPVC